jgi:hypothetical protein
LTYIIINKDITSEGEGEGEGARGEGEGFLDEIVRKDGPPRKN